MFDQRKGTWSYTWAGIIGVVIFIIAVIQIFRVNPPARQNGLSETKVRWTEGGVFKGPGEVEAGAELTYRINLNRKATLKAFFTTGKNEKKLASAVIKAEDFNMWKSGGEVQTFVSTGPVPRGTVTRVLEPGNYVFVLDNRFGVESIVLTEMDISVE
ncbi:MAG: hypothetical protein ABIR33_17500 [Pyrinomonadaceae bacterium]